MVLARIVPVEDTIMSPNGSQAHSVFDVEQLIVNISPKVSMAVRYACRYYGHQTNWAEVMDLSQDILVTLISDGGRALRTFANHSSIDTWLKTVVRRELRSYFLKRRWEKENFRNVDELSPEDLRCEANQEERLM